MKYAKFSFLISMVLRLFPLVSSMPKVPSAISLLVYLMIPFLFNFLISKTNHYGMAVSVTIGLLDMYFLYDIGYPIFCIYGLQVFIIGFGYIKGLY